MPKMKDVDLAWATTAPVIATATARTDVAPEKVWAAVSDHTAWAAWFSGVSRVELGDPSTGVGGTRKVFLPIGWAQERILAWEPDKQFAFVVTESTLPFASAMVENVEIDDVGAGSLIRYTTSVDPSLLFRFAKPVLKVALSNVVQRGLKGLVKYVEA